MCACQVMLSILGHALQQCGIAFLRIDGGIAKAGDRQVLLPAVSHRDASVPADTSLLWCWHADRIACCCVQQ